MKNSKVFSFLFFAALAIGFTSCESNDDTPQGNVTELIGEYSGSEKILFTDSAGTSMLSQTIATPNSVWFRVDLDNSANQLVSTPDLGDSIVASSFNVSLASYTFKLSPVMRSETLVPDYINSWFVEKHPGSVVNGIAWNLNSEIGGTYDRVSQKMLLPYTGTLSVAYTLNSVQDTAVYSANITYIDLIKYVKPAL